MSVEEVDLRTELQNAFNASHEEAPAPEPAQVPPDKPAEVKTEGQRPRDERGRFVSGAEKTEAPAAEVKAVEAAPAIEAHKDKPAEIAAPVAPDKPAALAPPNGWSAQAKAKWHELSPEVQAAIDQREKDVAKFTSKTDDERAFGRDMQRVIQPYLPVIKAAGATPSEAIGALLNTAYILRTADPQTKRQALLQVAQQYGVDLGAQQQQPTGDPEVAQLKQQLNALQSQLTQRENDQFQQTQAGIQKDIDVFAADPKHSHYQEVKAHMAALLRAGLANDLQDAYDQACHARPDIRATLLAQERAAEEQKRRSEEKARAETARAKGISITGGPGAAAAKSAPNDRSLRDELAANYRASTGAV